MILGYFLVAVSRGLADLAIPYVVLLLLEHQLCINLFLLPLADEALDQLYLISDE